MIYTKTLETPLGPMLAASCEGKICLLEFTDRKGIDKQLAVLEKYYGTERSEKDQPVLLNLAGQLKEYFEGCRKDFDLPLSYRGTTFQEKVWNWLLTVPYGTTLSYGEQAGALGASNAVRAVAGANAKNRIAIIIPCHRITGKNGNLTGYAGGVDRKARLLALEK